MSRHFRVLRVLILSVGGCLVLYGCGGGSPQEAARPGSSAKTPATGVAPSPPLPPAEKRAPAPVPAEKRAPLTKFAPIEKPASVPMPAPPIERPPVGVPLSPDSTKGTPKILALEEEPEPGDHTVVEVFYGTDRGTIGAEQSIRSTSVHWLVATLASAGATMILAAVGYRYLPNRGTRGLTKCAIGVTVGLGLWTGYTGWSDLGARRPASSAVAYGPQRGEMAFGKCSVTIPKDHKVGRLESPSILRLEFCENPERHVVLVGIEPSTSDKFYADLAASVGKSKNKEALVFIHGFNVTFDDAVRRTAQVAYDLKFPGAPICYSWPSQGQLLKYAVDETNVEWTVPHLKQFLVDVARRSGAKQIYLLAHSMGNRALTAALRYLAYEAQDTRPLFREVVLTAPDIDAEVFRRDIAPAIARTAQRVTLYASSNDEALVLSKQFHGYPRAGDTGGNLVVLSGVDTIDVSAVDTSLVGHSYYGSNDSVLADMFDLLQAGKPPDQRRWLRAQALGQLKYWIFRR